MHQTHDSDSPFHWISGAYPAAYIVVVASIQEGQREEKLDQHEHKSIRGAHARWLTFMTNRLNAQDGVASEP